VESVKRTALWQKGNTMKYLFLLIVFFLCLVTFAKTSQACICSCGKKKAWCKDSKVWWITEETCGRECGCRKNCTPTCKGDVLDLCRFGCRTNKVITDFRGIKSIAMHLCNPFPSENGETESGSQADGQKGHDVDGGTSQEPNGKNKDGSSTPKTFPGCVCSAKGTNNFDLSWLLFFMLAFFYSKSKQTSIS
tara:strand:- start:1301 stop:1876 length:576 start_codon:yes stop_codon:yes gene_type:complete